MGYIFIFRFRLVDSRDIVELQLKQDGCEVLIRKKEALAPPPAPPMVMMQSSQPQAMFHSQPPPPQAAPTPSAPALSPPAPAPAPAKPKSSHPPLKCPMAGTFYRAPAPGAPAFVKVIITKIMCPRYIFVVARWAGWTGWVRVKTQNRAWLKVVLFSTSQNGLGWVDLQTLCFS